ncbi:MAG TPA: thioredoxin domain-containing protein [Gaiellaceae bacterium]
MSGRLQVSIHGLGRKRKTILKYKGLSFALVALLAFSALLAAAQAAPGATKIVGAASVDKMLQGIPQQGIVLGKPDAPITMIEFVEPQCPGCGEWARTELPGVTARYVRLGKIKLEYRGISFLGSDSKGLLTLAQAAGEQNKLWNVVELEYQNQGSEGSGYADQAYLEAIAKAVPGLNAAKALALTGSSKVAARIDEAQALSEQYQIRETPSFAIGKTGHEQNMTVMAKVWGQGLYSSIDDALAGKPVPAKSAGLPAWAIVLIVMAGVAVLSGAIAVLARRSERRHAPPPAA